jgi:asparaginyl-tRNA synthetase
MKRIRVRDALQAKSEQESLCIQGWIRTRRTSKNVSFLEINDGSCLKNIQIIVDPHVEHSLEYLTTGASVSIQGRLVKSPGKGQAWEIQAERIELLGEADQERYPLQKKRHSDEFLRTIAHLRPRTNKFGALNRIRSELALAVHDFFRQRGFLYIQTPIITSSDCEGAGELFRVTSLNLEELPPQERLVQDDFFKKKAYLTVSGQLTAEVMACALGNVYTFGPTFRAENSNTPRHAAEFWMVEPEMAFTELEGCIATAEELIKYLIGHIQKNCSEDLGLFDRFVDPGLLSRLQDVEQAQFVHLYYTEAIEILEKAHSWKEFQYIPAYGSDLQTEHERYLVEEKFQRPVVVKDFPKAIKPFYMRVQDDGLSAAAFDILLPHVGEIVGGSQREERLDILENRVEEQGMRKQDYEWYLDLRRYGTVPHSGFGLGFERLLMFLTGVHNIRDVLPFPRTPNTLEY